VCGRVSVVGCVNVLWERALAVACRKWHEAHQLPIDCPRIYRTVESESGRVIEKEHSGAPATSTDEKLHGD